MAKSALTMAAYAGVNPQDTPLVLSYLRGDTDLPCIDPYYMRDPVLNRVPGMPLNCVYVAGDPDCRRLVAYVEIYGVLKRVICLSDTYMGRAFDDYYAFDPTDGSLQTVRIDLDPSTVNPSGNETFNQATIDKMCQALNAVLNKAVVAAHENEVGRLVHTVFDEFYTSTGKGVDEPLSDDEVGQLTTLIMSSLEPFLSQLIQRLNLPSDEYGALLPGDHWALLRPNRH